MGQRTFDGGAANKSWSLSLSREFASARPCSPPPVLSDQEQRRRSLASRSAYLISSSVLKSSSTAAWNSDTCPAPSRTRPAHGQTKRIKRPASTPRRGSQARCVLCLAVGPEARAKWAGGRLAPEYHGHVHLGPSRVAGRGSRHDASTSRVAGHAMMHLRRGSRVTP